MSVASAQLHYRLLCGLVAERLEGGVTAQETGEVVAAMNARYPDHPAVAAAPNLMAENVRAVAAELTGQ